MKKSIFLGLLFFLSFIIIGCSNFQPSSISDYYNVSTTYTTDSATVYYSIASVDNTIATGYSISQTLPSIGISLETTPKDAYSGVILPRITFSSMKISYAVVGDTAGIIGTWKPSSLETGVSITIPGSSSGGSGEASSSASVFATLNNIATNALGSEVLNKIGTVVATPNVSGNYVFSLTLNTMLTLRADVTLTGKDDRDKAVTLPFSTTISFAKRS